MAGDPWQATAEPWRSSFDGNEVDLNAAEDASALYVVSSHGTNTITVFTGDDLSAVVGQELVGVYRFQQLEVINGAYLTVGGDLLLVEDLPASDISTGTVDAGAGSILP